jgi:hypothetical protein
MPLSCQGGDGAGWHHTIARFTPPLPDGLPRQMMTAWPRCRAMSGASTARSQHGAASRNAWRRARDFPCGCGGLHSEVRTTARRPAKRCSRDIGWPSVTATRLTPRNLSRCQRRCPPCSASASTVSGERPCGREAMPGPVRRGMGGRIPAGMAARCRRPVERPGELPAQSQPSRRCQGRGGAQAQRQASRMIGHAAVPSPIPAWKATPAQPGAYNDGSAYVAGGSHRGLSSSVLSSAVRHARLAVSAPGCWCPPLDVSDAWPAAQQVRDGRSASWSRGSGARRSRAAIDRPGLIR